MNVGQLVINCIIILVLWATLFFVGISDSTSASKNCHTIDYTQRGRWQALEICVGDSAEIHDTGLARKDSVFMQKFAQPVIDSLKQTRK